MITQRCLRFKSTLTMKTSTSLSLPIYLLVFAALMSFSTPFTLPDEVVARTNEFRKANGLPALQVNDHLNELAQKHSEAMAKGRTSFGHAGFDKRNAQATAQIKTLSSFAENVAYGAETATQVVDNWKNSAGHRKNMLGKTYKLIGVGIARSKNGQLFYTQIFGG